MSTSKWKEVRQPCPIGDPCASSDGYNIDHEGNGWCFSCSRGTFNESSSSNTVSVEVTQAQADLIIGGVHKAIPERSLSKETCEFFDVKTEENRWIFPYHNSEGNLVAQKTLLKQLNEKGKKIFPWKGIADKAVLFGQHKFSGGHTITITEGEFDALAFRDLSGDYPVVSVSKGAAKAADEIKHHLDYFKNFGTVYVCFDNDEYGKKAAIEVAELFPIGKVKIVSLRHFKDANEYLVAGKKKEFMNCWWNAIEYTPAGIEAATAGGFESLFDDIDELELFPYPYDKLNESTFGIRKGEMVTVVAGSGVGKSAFVGEVAYKLLMDNDRKCGMLMLEESPKKTKLRFMSLFLNKPLHLTLLGRVAGKFDFLKKVLDKLFKNSDDWEWTPEIKEELKGAWENVIERKTKEGENQLWLFKHFGSNNIDTIVSRIDAMVTGLGCEFIVLDHISIVVSEQQNGDERKALDELATKLRTLVERRNFALLIVSHLRRPGGKPHEEGGETSLSDIRGTAGIGQLSDVVIGLERNGQHENEQLRNITAFRVLKNRFAGFTGLAGHGEYDIETGRLTEIDSRLVEEMEKEGTDSDGFTAMPDPDQPVFDSTPTGELINEREA
jgi:twinkle protein